MTVEPVTLALETSSRVGSVALGLADRILAEHTFSAPLRHSTELLPAIESLLSSSRLDRTSIRRVCISVGPGSFTGLRIAVATAKAMHFASGVQIVAVDTLDVIAANVSAMHPCPPRIACIIDAKRNQFFVAAYQRGEQETAKGSDRHTQPGKIVQDSLMTAETFLKTVVAQHSPIALLGDGLLYYRERFKAKGVTILAQDTWSPRAVNVYWLGQEKARAGDFADPLTLTPLYLRSPQVTLKH